MKKFNFILFILFLLPYYVFAANIYVDPNKEEIEINRNLKITVYIDSDKEINAVGARVKFDSKYLKVINISESGSIINFWALKPNFDNNKGEINFEGVILNKPFKGEKGKIIEINFRANKEINSTELNFENVQILASDGEGTNIFEKSFGGNYKIYRKIEVKELETEEESEKVLGKYTLPKPIIISLTHPDQNKWYNNNNVEFKWQLFPEIDLVRLIFSNYIDSKPSIIYKPPIDYKKIENVSDGIYYFKLQFENREGISEIATYRVKIDTLPPELKLEEIPRKYIYELPKFQIIAKDNLSGINYFEIYFDNSFLTSTKQTLIDLESFKINIGKHILGVKAIDFADNFNYQTINFEIGEKDILTEKKITQIKSDILKINFILLLLILFLLILTLILLLVYFKNKSLIYKIENKIKEIENFSHKSFISLRKDLEEQLRVLESKSKKELIEEEKKIIEHLKKHIKYIDNTIEKNLKNIDELLK